MWFPHQRLLRLPDIASAKEVGIKLSDEHLGGIFAPRARLKKSSPSLLLRWTRPLDDPLVRSDWPNWRIDPAKQERTPVSFARLVKAEIARWSPILKAASLTTN